MFTQNPFAQHSHHLRHATLKRLAAGAIVGAAGLCCSSALAQPPPGGGGGEPVPPSFRDPMIFGVGDQPYGLALGDLNCDGWLDLVVVNQTDSSIPGSDGTISVFLNNRDWDGLNPLGFRPETRYGLPEAACPFDVCLPREVKLAHMNDDYLLDIVVTNSAAQSVAIFFQFKDPNTDGCSGVFLAPVFYTTDGGGWDVSVNGLEMRDVDNDGVPDVVVAGIKEFGGQLDANVVKVLLGPAGKWTPSTVPVLVNNVLNPGPVRSAFDLAGGFLDGVGGFVDFVTCNQTESNLSVLLSQGNGNFQVSDPPPPGPESKGIATGILRNGFITDVVCTEAFNDQQTPGNVHVYFGDGQGALVFAERYEVGRDPFDLAVGRINFDGAKDIVVANQHGVGAGGLEVGTISVLLGAVSDGQWVPLHEQYEFFVDTDHTLQHKPCQLVLGDLNNDNSLDVVTGNTLSGTVSVLINAQTIFGG